MTSRGLACCRVETGVAEQTGNSMWVTSWPFFPIPQIPGLWGGGTTSLVKRLSGHSHAFPGLMSWWTILRLERESSQTDRQGESVREAPGVLRRFLTSPKHSLQLHPWVSPCLKIKPSTALPWVFRQRPFCVCFISLRSCFLVSASVFFVLPLPCIFQRWG